MNENILTQLRKKGLSFDFVSWGGETKIKISPRHLIKGEALYWLKTQKKEIVSLLKKEKKLRALIEQVAINGHCLQEKLEEEVEETFQDVIKHHSLDDAITAFQLTCDRQAKLIPEHYTKPVNCLCCGDVKLWNECPENLLGCPMCLERL